MRADLERLGAGARRVEESHEHVEAASTLLGGTGGVGDMFGGFSSAAAVSARLAAVKADHAAGLESHRTALSGIAADVHATARAVDGTDTRNADSIAEAGD